MSQERRARPKLHTRAEPYDFPPEVQRPVSVRKLGAGSHGCAVQVDLVPAGQRTRGQTYDMLPVIAIKYSRPHRVSASTGDADREFLIAQQVDGLREQLRVSAATSTSLAFRVFTAFKVPHNSLTPDWKATMEGACPAVAPVTEAGDESYDSLDEAEEIPQDRAEVVYVMESESAPAGSVRTKTYHDTKFTEQPLGREAVGSIVFQVCLAMDVLWRELRFRHHDLKLPNVLAFAPRENDNSGRLPAQHGIPDPHPYLVKIADFGRSQTMAYPSLSREERGVTPNWKVQPLDWFLETGTEEEDLRINARDTGPDADVWSVGLMVLHLGLLGSDVSTFGHFWRGVDLSLAEAPRFWWAHFYGTVKNHSPFRTAVLDHLINAPALGPDLRPNGLLRPKVQLLAAVCQLQEALGNRFLPATTPRRQANRYYRALQQNRVTIIDSCRRTFPVRSETDRANNPNLFCFLVARLEQNIGQNGVDFVRRAMSWEAAERRQFLQERQRDGRVMFGAALSHPFLSQFTLTR